MYKFVVENLKYWANEYEELEYKGVMLRNIS
jgi:hypothetical protein